MGPVNLDLAVRDCLFDDFSNLYDQLLFKRLHLGQNIVHAVLVPYYLIVELAVNVVNFVGSLLLVVKAVDHFYKGVLASASLIRLNGALALARELLRAFNEGGCLGLRVENFL